MQTPKIINITAALETEYQTLTQKKEKEFPIEVFHPVLQELILELQKKMNYAIEYTTASILSACSTAIGSQFKVEVKRNTWYEKCNLYVIIVGIAGSTKSHPLSFAFDPIHARDKDSYKMYQFDLKEYQENQERSKDDKEKGLEKPVYTKSVISDFTPEALAMSHANNPKGITIVVDELKGWLNNFDRYNSGGEEQMYLSLWSGKSWLIDRKTQEPIRIDDPFVNVIGTIQPKLIQDFAKGDKSDNGFLDRMIFAWPKIEQPNLWNDQEVEEQHLNNYQILIQNLYDLNQSVQKNNLETEQSENSVILTFEKAAKDYLFNWQNKEETKLLDRDNNYEKSIFAKIQNYAIRFCLIIHLQDIACELEYNSKIKLEVVKRAIQLAEYFRKVSLEIRETIENPNPLIDLSIKQKNLLFALPKEFSKKEGVIIADTFKMPYATFSRFLKKEVFFEKSTYGNYKKLV
jgi:hypothetical protein